MKKFVLIVCAALLFMLCAGCGSGDKTPQNTQVVQNTSGAYSY